MPETAEELEMGVLLARVEGAIRSIGEIGRVHVCRWGDGSEHLHWWFQARPARVPQLLGTFAAVWDDVLPPLPENIWRATSKLSPPRWPIPVVDRPDTSS